MCSKLPFQRLRYYTFGLEQHIELSFAHKAFLLRFQQQRASSKLAQRNAVLAPSCWQCKCSVVQPLNLLQILHAALAAHCHPNAPKV